MELYLYCTLALLLALGGWNLSAALLRNERYTNGRRELRQIRKWQKTRQDLWQLPLVQRFLTKLSRLVYLDRTGEDALRRQLARAGMSVTPQQFTARKYLVLGLGVAGILLCAALKFWLGVLLGTLLTIWVILRQRETLTERIKARDDAIAMEMPRFVRTLCRSLLVNRDITSALTSYRKVAGPVLAGELDILLGHLRSGGVSGALQQFQQRLGTEDAFRLCSTLREIDRGIDQTATLSYLAEDMTRKARLSMQKALATRPQKMRMTYLPAVGVCIAMIFYVLIIFVSQQLNSLF